jgi:hypothetical protein
MIEDAIMDKQSLGNTTTPAGISSESVKAAVPVSASDVSNTNLQVV